MNFKDEHLKVLWGFNRIRWEGTFPQMDDGQLDGVEKMAKTWDCDYETEQNRSPRTNLN